MTDRATEIQNKSSEPTLHADVFEQLHPDHPAQKTIYEVVKNIDVPDEKDRQVIAMLDKFGVDDPANFAASMHHLDDRAKHDQVSLNMDSLQKYSNDQTLSAADRVVAGVMHDDIRPFATYGGSRDSYMFYPDVWLSVHDNNVSAISKEAERLELARNHN